MPFTIIRNDVTKMHVDAIVNAANTALQMGGGVCGAIFHVAGAAELQAACDLLAPIQTGEAVITPGFKLPAKYVIHAAGPVYLDGKHGEERLLRACYHNSLKRAIENDCESVAFPLISSGIYGYPKAEALRVATSAIQDFLADHDMEVSLVVFDKTAFTVSEKLLGEVKAYIDENYIGDFEDPRRYRSQLLQVELDALQMDEAFADAMDEDVSLSIDVEFVTEKHTVCESISIGSIEDLFGDLDEPFSQTLLRLIDLKGMTDVEVYKRANLDRRLFSKIRSNKEYMPSKRTAIAIAIALELTLSETKDLLQRAGYALSHSQKFDVIVEFFIASGNYDIFEINEVLFQYDQPLLGGSA